MSLSRVDAASHHVLQNSLLHAQSNVMNLTTFPVLPMIMEHSAWKTLVGPMAGPIAYLGCVKKRALDTHQVRWLMLQSGRQTVTREYNIHKAIWIPNWK